MFKAIFGFLSFIILLVVLIIMLTAGMILRAVRKMRKAAMDAVNEREQQYRDETGRQRQQYSQRQQTRTAGPTSDTGYTSDMSDDDAPRQTQTETGETIIDHHHQQRENKKIFDDADGEYVEFTEE